MNQIKIGDLNVSRLCLGCGKLVNLRDEEGYQLIKRAVELGINIFDAHHRYGNAERVLGSFGDQILAMTKVTAYSIEKNYWDHVNNSIKTFKNIPLYWISDLDDEKLYNSGKAIYEKVKKEYGHTHLKNVGITSENPSLVFRFLKEYPECKFVMIPVYPGNNDMVTACRILNHIGVHVFAIKPFDDGRALKKHSIKDCLSLQFEANPAVTIFGTSSIKHLEEVVETWESM